MNLNRVIKLNEKINNLEQSNRSFGNTPNEIKNEIVNEFIHYAYNFLKIDEKCDEILVDFNDFSFVDENSSFGGYSPDNRAIYIVGKNRNLADVLRTLGHEMVHHKQNIDGRLHNKSGETGSEHENEANSIAGVLLRNYGKMNKKIYVI